jgi:hypothetical protein
MLMLRNYYLNSMKTALQIGLVMVLGIVSLKAQQAINWQNGTVALANDELLSGQLSFQTAQFVLFKSDKQVTVFPAHKVRWFRFDDSQVAINRKFISIKQRNNQHAIFEMVLWGKVNIVRELKSIYLNDRTASHVHDFDYYTYNNNRLIKLKKFKRDVYPSLTTRFSDLSELVKQARLNPASEADAIQIAQLYNQLCRDRVIVANR